MHDLVIILDLLAQLMGNATTGKLAELHTAVDDVQLLIESASTSKEDADAMHESLHKVEGWLQGSIATTPTLLLNELKSYL